MRFCFPNPITDQFNVKFERLDLSPGIIINSKVLLSIKDIFYIGIIS